MFFRTRKRVSVAITVVTFILCVQLPNSVSSSMVGLKSDKDNNDHDNDTLQDVPVGAIPTSFLPRSKVASSSSRPQIKSKSTISTVRKERNIVPSLSEQAKKLTGNLSFVRRLEQEEKEEEQQQAHLLRYHNNDEEEDDASNKVFYTEASSPSSFSSGIPVIQSYYSSFYAAILAFVLSASFFLPGAKSHRHSKSSSLQTLISESVRTLAVAWVPTLIIHGSWVEVLSLGTLLLQSSTRHYLLYDFLPDMGLTLKRILISEIWRYMWGAVMAPLPKPLFFPSPKRVGADNDDGWRRRMIPSWMKHTLHKLQSMADKTVQKLILKSIQSNVHETFGIVYDSVANSMMEINFIYGYYEDSVDGNDDDSSLSSAVVDDSDDEEEEVPMIGLYVNDDDPVCDGFSCSFDGSS